MQKFGRRFRSASLVLFLFCKLSFKQLRTNIRLNIIIMINNSWTRCKYIELTVNVQKKSLSLCMKTSNKYQGKFLNYDSLRNRKKIKKWEERIRPKSIVTVISKWHHHLISTKEHWRFLAESLVMYASLTFFLTRNNMEVEIFFFLCVYFLAPNRLCYFLAY